MQGVKKRRNPGRSSGSSRLAILDAAARSALIDMAIANGTHSEKTLHVCGVCRQWVTSIFHIGFDGTRMCPACADLIGEGPAALQRRMETRAR